jgi:hypothetical protein
MSSAVECPLCGFAVPLQKKARAGSLRCPECFLTFEPPQRSRPGAPETNARPTAALAPGREEPSLEIAHASGPPAAGDWYLQVLGEEFGPVSFGSLRHGVRKGRVGPDTLVRLGKDGRWVLAERVSGLFAGVGSGPATLPPPVADTEPANEAERRPKRPRRRPSRPRWPIGDLFLLAAGLAGLAYFREPVAGLWWLAAAGLLAIIGLIWKSFHN